MFYSLTEGWDPPMIDAKDSSRWRAQHHLRFTMTGLAPRRRLGVVLVPGHAGLAAARVSTERAGAAEVAHVGDDLIMVNQAERMAFEGHESDALIRVVTGGAAYEVTDEGIGPNVD